MEDNMVYIDGKWVKKPTKGKCAYCGSDLLEFYDDGTGICLNCGRTFSWLKPLAGPVSPQAEKTREPKMQQRPAPVRAHREPPARAPGRGPPSPVVPPEPPIPSEFPEGPGFLSPRAISIMAFIGALLIGIGAIIYIVAIPMGSWPKPSDGELIGNLIKVAMIIWASGTMVFLMAGFAAAGTREMNYRVRAALIVSSVVLAIFSFSLWLGMRFFSMGFYP